ncbi:hypothetical protein PCC8801_4106 [Rippkaea orientalis PCC 8801]|uniref:Uncharacterized protein n=1 Tax=Rippkaea orientalis (strain PCC 8801 / RF-1) TaxID=41431 RepID=B7K5Y5_RIPO1|nr:hypothetical protein [Rippkaea orientalis]ACK68038.1 hypothetical protein PCC8801_4106 [Rippkaea orientalis PCC 8801]
MSQVHTLLFVWISLTFISILFGYLIHYFFKRSLKKLSLTDFMNIALANAAITSSFSLMYRAITSEELIKLLQFEIVTLFLGAIAVIWISIQQIWQIFK